MQTVIAADVPVRAQDPTRSARPGSILRQNLLAGTAEDTLSFRLIRSQYQDGESAFESPRHHHAFQQLRWTESGSVNYAPGQEIPEGDLAYFPCGAYYGPQRKDQGAALLVQYGFGDEFLHRHGRQEQDDAEEVLQRLREAGTFTGGEYVDTDPDTGHRRHRDAVQAIYDAKAVRTPRSPACTALAARPTPSPAPTASNSSSSTCPGWTDHGPKGTP